MSATILQGESVAAATDWRTHWIGRSFSIDLRSLALFRIAIGLVLFRDIVQRFGDLEALHADTGILPRAMLFELYDAPVLSLHALSGSVTWQAVLLTIAAAAAICLILGYRTRVAVVVSWLMLLSIHVRNPFILNGGDVYLLDLLLWSTLLPLGARWSLDAKRDPAPGPDRLLSIASAGILLQVAGLYLISVLYKTGEPWGSELTAVYYAVHLDGYATAIGEWMTGWPLPLLQLLTAATLTIEIAGPVVALSPFRTAYCRMAAVVTFIGFHLSMRAALTLGMFTWAACIAWLLFVPCEFWERIRDLREGAGPGRRVGRETPLAVPDSRVRPATLLATGMLLAALIAVISAVGRDFDALRTVGAPMRAIRFTQHWNMFSPQPSTRGTWFTFTGYTSTGDAVDVLHGGSTPPTGEARPPSSLYPSARWRKYLFSWYSTDAWTEHRAALPAFLWKRWHDEHPDRPLDRIEVRQFIARTAPPGTPELRSDTLLVVYRDVH